MENNTSTEFVNLVMRKIAKQHHGYSNANQFMRSEGLRVRRSIVKSIHNGTLLNVLRHYKVQVKVPERILKSLSERRHIGKMKNKRDVNLVTAVSRLEGESASLKNNSKSNPREFPSKSVKEVLFNDSRYTLFICQGSIHCKRNKHKIIPATGILYDIHKEKVYINVNYCVECEKYFIGYAEYMAYREKYGALLGNFKFKDYMMSRDENQYGRYSAHSILNLVGYTVSQKYDYTPCERHLILVNVMERGILSKNQIIDYLHFFINNSNKRERMGLANSKWKDDLNWIRLYNLKKQRSFLIKNIVK